MFSSVGIQAVSVVVLASVLSPPGGGGGQRKVEDKMTRSGGDDDFVFTFRSTMDPLTEKLYQLMDVTTVDLRSGMAMQFASRQSDDAPGAVGLFAAKLPPNRVTALAKLLTEIRWGQLPEPNGGDINAAQLSIDIRRGKQIVQVGFNAANTGPFMRALGPVIDLVGEIEHDLSGHPLRALNVAVERTPRGLRLSVKNVGAGPVMIADARSRGKAGRKTRGRIEVGYVGPDGGPPPLSDLRYDPVALQTDGKDKPYPPVVLAPGQAHEIDSVPWAPSTPGKYIIAGSWEDYDGLGADSNSVMPMLPGLDQLDDKRPYLMLGAAFSKAVKVVVEPPPHR